ncbi:hypothetical protein M084_0723 [Bacteroides fragilis str. 3988 T1]|uniref:Uncharacterized protein n=1 Tax=Bacteroides fragilis str. 2-F-2 \|nr:hypothetical protein M118_0763 [Bacteroides fragilis str. 3783N1-2]EXY81494.1 hypothetical protein M084_0723 [Bacteroides fragilis str. 3988 T1]EXZ11169.1 hypothetical protein M073_0732 [Bacteroides fragilis str. DS-71]EXZ45936.1 hypothetical protein M076_0770 [Bacteroides fragilis str. 2-F-2 \
MQYHFQGGKNLINKISDDYENPIDYPINLVDCAWGVHFSSGFS